MESGYSRVEDLLASTHDSNGSSMFTKLSGNLEPNSRATSCYQSHLPFQYLCLKRWLHFWLRLSVCECQRLVELVPTIEGRQDKRKRLILHVFVRVWWSIKFSAINPMDNWTQLRLQFVGNSSKTVKALK